MRFFPFSLAFYRTSLQTFATLIQSKLAQREKSTTMQKCVGVGMKGRMQNNGSSTRQRFKVDAGMHSLFSAVDWFGVPALLAGRTGAV
jgi:hypothetical protein